LLKAKEKRRRRKNYLNGAINKKVVCFVCEGEMIFG